jgi:hypothetical protein
MLDRLADSLRVPLRSLLETGIAVPGSLSESLCNRA